MVHMTFLTRCQAGRIHQILREFARHPGSPVVTKNWNNKNHPKNKYINTDTIVLSHLPIPQLIIGWPSFFLERYQEFLVILIIRGFLKNAGFPQQPLVFPSKNDHFGVVWGGLGVPPFKETPIYSYEIWIFPPSPWTPRFFFSPGTFPHFEVDLGRWHLPTLPSCSSIVTWIPWRMGGFEESGWQWFIFVVPGWAWLVGWELWGDNCSGIFH